MHIMLFNEADIFCDVAEHAAARQHQFTTNVKLVLVKNQGPNTTPIHAIRYYVYLRNFVGIIVFFYLIQIYVIRIFEIIRIRLNLRR